MLVEYHCFYFINLWQYSRYTPVWKQIDNSFTKKYIKNMLARITGYEEEIRPGVVEKLHKDVYYIDGCSVEEALTILLRIGVLMIRDGLCSFGFGCHESMDEIVFGKYNVTTIFSNNIEQYMDFMADHGIPKSDHITTAWDTFSQEHPGSSERIDTDGKDVFLHSGNVFRLGNLQSRTAGRITIVFILSTDLSFIERGIFL